MRNVFFFIFIFAFLLSQSQNLVINGGLEVFDSSQFKPLNKFNNEHVSGIEIAPDWYTVTPATPDYFNLPFSTDTANNILVMPLKGEGRIGIIGGSCRLLFGSNQYKEYVTGFLKEPLVSGKKYEVSFYIALDPRSTVAIDNFGVIFSDTSLRYSEQHKLPFQPDVLVYNGSAITSENGWIKLSAVYNAGGGEKHITIGSFSMRSCIPLSNLGKSPSAVIGDQRIVYNAYYYLDEISVIETEYSQIKNDIYSSKKSMSKADRYLLLIDISQSMSEQNKLDVLKKSVFEVISGLPEDAEIGVITYQSNPKLVMPYTKINDLNTVMKFIDSLVAGGNTDFSAAVNFAYNYSRKKDRDIKGKDLIIVFTDGVFSVESSIQKRIKTENKDHGIGFSVMQFGDTKNGDLLRLVTSAKGDYMENSGVNFTEKLEKVIFKYQIDSLPNYPILFSYIQEEKDQLALNGEETIEHKKKKFKWFFGIFGGMLASSIALFFYFR